MDWKELASIPASARPRAVREVLDRAGLPQAERVASAFSAMLDLPIFATAANRVLSHFLKVGSPARAAAALHDAVVHLEQSRGDASPLFVEPILEILSTLAGASARGASLLARDPLLAIELGAKAHRERVVEPSDPFRSIVERTRGDTVAFDRALRRHRHREVLRIALAELRGADVRDTAREMADLASGSLDAALAHHLPLVETQFGALDPPCRRVVMGMGKLGGRELNFSSDIDLIYLYEHDRSEAGATTAHLFHVKLFERVTASIDRITEHGFVFRVDLDLRPEGRRGPLANSLASAERYYETWGRTWERAAWTKARPVAGDLDLGNEFIAMTRPFVYPKALDVGAIDALVEMKKMIDAAETRAPRSKRATRANLKLGRGGIREIEFFVQAHQLLRGGRDARLRVTNTLRALHVLEAAGLVSARTREVLADAYLSFRKIEHRVQIVDEQQTHALPDDPDAACEIARSLGYARLEDLEAAIARRMREVHALFSAMLGAIDATEDIPENVAVLVGASADDDAKARALVDLGVGDPLAALANLSAASRHPRSPYHRSAERDAKERGLRFLVECLASPNADRALTHLPDLMRALMMHSSYLELLDRPTLRRGVARVLGASDLLARILVSNPALLPHVLVEETLPSRALLEDTSRARLEAVSGDLEASLDVLRSVKQEEILRVAMGDLAQTIDTRIVGERLSDLAEFLIGECLALAECETVARFGTPRDPRAQMVVVGGGTLGAREMGYRTDLDLSVLYVGDGMTSGGEKSPIGVGEFYTRVVQRLLSFLSMRMRGGDLYPVDMRLRPSGSHGALVTSLENFEAYHHQSAQLWERQALVRSRPIAGSAEMAARVRDAIHRATYDPGPVLDAAKRIHDMRVRMERERSTVRTPSDRTIDLKFGRGGIVEIEFLVQHLLILHGRERRELRTESTRRALEALAAAGILRDGTGVRLIRAADRIRSILNWLRVMHDEAVDYIDLDDVDVRSVAIARGYQGSDARDLFERDLVDALDAIHAVYTKLVTAFPADR